MENITEAKWEQIKENSFKWRGLHRFGNVYDQEHWENCPNGLYMHHSCYVTLSSKRKLSQFQKCKYESYIISQQMAESVSEIYQPEPECIAPKTLRSSTGVLHNKMLCVWCMEGKSKKSDNYNKLFLLSTTDAWMKFKNHTMYIDNQEMRERLNMLISFVSDYHTVFVLRDTLPSNVLV